MKNTQVQIEGIKNQTIGVEVEMNNITRAKAAQIAAEFFGTHRHETPPAATDTAPSPLGTARGASGNSRKT